MSTYECTYEFHIPGKKMSDRIYICDIGDLVKITQSAESIMIDKNQLKKLWRLLQSIEGFRE